MVDVQTIITIVSILIALGSLTIAVITATRNSRNDTKAETKENVEIHVGLQSQIDTIRTTLELRLESIDGGVRDLRADNRGMRSELTKMRDDLRDEIREIHDEAHHAIELAEAAHRRLDRLGAEPDILVKKIEKEKNND